MTPSATDHIDPEVERTLAALVSRHPAFGAHERFVHDRLTELALRAFQHGASSALLSLSTSTQAGQALGVTRAWVKRVAKRHGIGWNVGGDWVFRPDDIEQLRGIMATRQPGRPRLHAPQPLAPGGPSSEVTEWSPEWH